VTRTQEEFLCFAAGLFRETQARGDAKMTCFCNATTTGVMPDTVRGSTPIPRNGPPELGFEWSG